MTKEKLRKLNMWTREKIAHLIQLYRQNECLWNPYHSMYKNKTIRIQAVDSICSQLNISKADYGKKIHNLRNQFNSEMKKLERRIEEAGSTMEGSSQRCRWEHFESLIFLQSVIEPRPGSYQMHNAKRIKCDYTSDEDPDNVINQSNSTHAVAALPVEESSDYIYEEAPDDEGETTDNAAPSEEYQFDEDPSPTEPLKNPAKPTPVPAPAREDISIEVKFKPSLAKPTQSSLPNGSTLITLPMTTPTACNRKESTPLITKTASSDLTKLPQRPEDPMAKSVPAANHSVAASGPPNVYSYPSSASEQPPNATRTCGGSNRDQWDVFGELIASEFRNLNSEVSRKKLKRKMMQAMLEVGEEDDLHATS